MYVPGTISNLQPSSSGILLGSGEGGGVLVLVGVTVTLGVLVGDILRLQEGVIEGDGVLVSDIVGLGEGVLVGV